MSARIVVQRIGDGKVRSRTSARASVETKSLSKPKSVVQADTAKAISSSMNLKGALMTGVAIAATVKSVETVVNASTGYVDIMRGGSLETANIRGKFKFFTSPATIFSSAVESVKAIPRVRLENQKLNQLRELTGNMSELKIYGR